MNVTIRISDDYEPSVGDTVLVLDEHGSRFELRLVRQTLDGTEWIGHSTAGTVFDYVLDPEEILGEVIA